MQEGAADEERLVQTVRAEIYDQTPLLSVHGGSFGSRQQLAIKKVSSSNLMALNKISQQNLASLAASGSHQSELLALRSDPASELERLVRRGDVVTGPLAVAITLALVTQFLNGYNTAALNAVSLVVFPGHSTTAWAAAVGAFAVGGPFGALAAGRLADALGRKQAMLLCTYGFLGGGAALTCAPSMPMLITARVVLGFSSGFSSVLVPVYMGELAPPSMRGFFGTCTQVARTHPPP